MKVHVWAEDRPLPEAEAQMRRIYPNGVEGLPPGNGGCHRDCLHDAGCYAGL